MTRIRYKKIDDCLSAGPFYAGNEEIMVLIDTKTFHSTITKKSNNVISNAIGWTNKNLNEAKISIKNHLKTFGVQFLDEIRPGKSNE